MILIDMEMPARCSRCPFVNIVILNGEVRDMSCTLTKARIDIETMERSPDCILREVKDKINGANVGWSHYGPVVGL